MLLVLQIVLVVLLAVVQFGLFFSNYQQLALASRVGAELASETSLPNQTMAITPLPTDITDLVVRQLHSSGIDPCAVILEHNVNGPAFTEQTLRTNYTPNCPTCSEPAGTIPTNSVRLTICVQLTELMPNCLSWLGFDIATRTSTSSTTFGYEL